MITPIHSPPSFTLPNTCYPHASHRPPLHFLLGLSALLLSHACLALQIEPVYTYFFSFAWWPYIVWIDGWVYWRTGQSLLITQPRTFLAAALLSIVAWCLYEAFNFRLQNWYYVMTPAPVWAYHLNYAVGFATVFPGLFETAALLASFGVFQQWRTPPFPVPSWLLRLLFVGGLLATLLPLMWPLLFFPLIWVSMALLFEPLLYRWQGQSLLAELARGEPQRLATLLTAGVINGGLWEGWNVLTRTGWIYTVPWLDWWHVFEMPLAGYLGFPLLAIECAVLWSVVIHFHLMKDALPRTTDATQTCVPPARTMLTVGIALVWVLLVFAGINRWTVSSHHLELAALPGTTNAEVHACTAAGFSYPYQLLSAVRQRGLPRVAAELHLPESRLSALLDTSYLSEFRGIGIRNVRLLHAVGITRITDLAQQDSVALTVRLTHASAELSLRPPYERQVRGWIVAAQRWHERHR